MNLNPSALIPGLDVSRETELALDTFLDRVVVWTSKIGLVSRGAINDLKERHLNDSAQLYLHLGATQKSWADLGSGGGFPGLVIAILARDARPDLRVTLIEADQRKATFLRMMAAELSLNAFVIPQRIEVAPKQAADIVSARALAPLVSLLAMVERHLASDGTALLLKGASHAEEIEAAREKWHFNVDVRQSITQPEAALLKIKDIRRA
jgi:16S rRNA (guanine527-N7)-methyltransferase